MAAHKDIRYSFEIDSRRFEAVGFLNEGELEVRGNIALLRTTDKNNAVGEESVAFLDKHLNQLPDALRFYQLITSRFSHDIPDSVLCFTFKSDRWSRYGWNKEWCWLGDLWRQGRLVLRRCV